MKKKEVNKFISEIENAISYSSNLGFFFGAGTSCAFGLPNIYQLTEEVRNRISEDYKNAFSSVCSCLKDVGNEDATIENILNHLRKLIDLTNGREDKEYCGINGLIAKKLDVEITRIIFEVIEKHQEEADISEMRKFVTWLYSNNNNKQKEIYTVNYDLLLELALESNYIPYIDGFIGSYEPFFLPDMVDKFCSESDSTSRWIRLWKMHGSLNWCKKGADSMLSERIIRVSRFKEKPENELMIYPSSEKYNFSRKEPYIAYFDRFNKYLKSGELVLFCSGYSFSDEHINEVLLNSLKQNNRLFVVFFCYTNEQIDKMLEHAKSHMNLCLLSPNYLVSNGEQYEWTFNENDENNSDEYWDKTDKKLKLGDFKKLIDFFVETSGRKRAIEDLTNGK